MLVKLANIQQTLIYPNMDLLRGTFLYQQAKPVVVIRERAVPRVLFIEKEIKF
jgi:hypothetical protein